MRGKIVFALFMDALMAASFGWVGTMIFLSGGVALPVALLLGVCLCAGIPFGWRWACMCIPGWSGPRMLAKLGFAVALGWLGIAVVLADDLLRCFEAPAYPVPA